MARDYKLQERCRHCNKQLKKYNPHHYDCDDCWVEKQLAKGNLTALNKGAFRVSR